MIQHRHAVRELGWMMIWQQKSARTDADVLGLQQRLSDQQIGRGIWLPWRRVMFADPGFLVAQFIEPAQYLQVPVVSFLQSTLRGMRRHSEIADVHNLCLLPLWRLSFATRFACFRSTARSVPVPIFRIFRCSQPNR